MTIRAQQPQISLVSRPVFKPARPRIHPALSFEFFTWVNVINVQCSIIAKTALNTLAAKFMNKRNLALPVSGSFVYFVAIDIPIILPAPIRAESYIAFIAALFALAVVLPAMLKVALLIAVLAGSLLDSVRVHHGRLTAALALNFNLYVSHALIISEYIRSAKPKYFEIACERIEQAQKQIRMFA